MTSLLDLAAAQSDPDIRASLQRAAARDALRTAIKGCTLCPLHQTSIQRVPWDGPSSPVAIVGEAPGANEDRVGRPFVGPAGRLLTKLLSQAGLDRDKLAVINRICCRPPSNDWELAKQVGAPASCQPWFRAQLGQIGAWILVLMGNAALSAFSDKPISSVRGKRWWQDGYFLVPTYHPAYALRNPEAGVSIINDLTPIKSILAGYESLPVPAGYDPSKAIASLRGEPDPQGGLSKFFQKKGYVPFYSKYLEARIVMVKSTEVAVPEPYTALPRYTVAEVERLARWQTKTWEDLRRVHTVKSVLGGEFLG